MNILIVGYGKMGKTIETLAEKRGHRIVAKVDSLEELRDVVTHQKDPVDVAIEFSQPDAAFNNIRFCLKTTFLRYPVPPVGWKEELRSIVFALREKDHSFMPQILVLG